MNFAPLEQALACLRLSLEKVEYLVLCGLVRSTDKAGSLETELNSNLTVQAINQIGHRPKSLVLGAIRLRGPPAVLTSQGHCRNVGIDLGFDAGPCSFNSVICRHVPLAS